MATKLKIYIILFILSFFSFSMAQNKINLKLYKEKKEKYFLKDEKISVYQKSFYTRANKFLFGCPIDGKRNDSIFLKGNILLRKNCIICKEEFFYDLMYVFKETWTFWNKSLRSILGYKYSNFC